MGTTQRAVAHGPAIHVSSQSPERLKTQTARPHCLRKRCTKAKAKTISNLSHLAKTPKLTVNSQVARAPTTLIGGGGETNLKGATPTAVNINTVVPFENQDLDSYQMKTIVR